jgi:hypothetical protein
MSDPWHGGGYGKYPGLTMSQIQESFDRCVADPSMRSISAVLRITHEQIDSRGRLGMYPTAVKLSLLGVLLLGVIYAVVPQELKDLALKALAVPALGLVLFGPATLRARHALTANVRQEHEIRVAALDALAKILRHEPTVKPLTREQRDMLKELLKKEQDPANVRVLLEQGT